MIKRVSFVSALLFANIVFGQVPVPTDASSVAQAIDTPVAGLSATGTTVNTELESIEVLDVEFPAETDILVEAEDDTVVVETESGAFGTSSALTVPLDTEETEEGTERNTTDTEDKERLFEIVYAGFEEFVRVTLGWE